MALEWIYNYNLHYIIRMIAACLCGILIGFERKNRAKEAGIRTHCIVCFAAALMMIISKYAFTDLLSDPNLTAADVRLDPSRVAQGIVQGVGFLGTGMIYVHKQSITGLTTAAGVWGTAGIGMAIGAGMYFLGFVATVIMVLAQVLLHFNAGWLRTPKHKKFSVYKVADPEFQSFAEAMMTEKKIQINDVNVTYDKKNKATDYEFIIELPDSVKESELCGMFDYDNKIRNL